MRRTRAPKSTERISCEFIEAEAASTGPTPGPLHVHYSSRLGSLLFGWFCLGFLVFWVFFFLLVFFFFVFCFFLVFAFF